MCPSFQVCKCTSKRNIHVQKIYEKCFFSDSGHITTDMLQNVLFILISIDRGYNWLSIAIQYVIFA